MKDFGLSDDSREVSGEIPGWRNSVECAALVMHWHIGQVDVWSFASYGC